MVKVQHVGSVRRWLVISEYTPNDCKSGTWRVGFLSSPSPTEKHCAWTCKYANFSVPIHLPMFDTISSSPAWILSYSFCDHPSLTPVATNKSRSATAHTSLQIFEACYRLKRLWCQRLSKEPQPQWNTSMRKSFISSSCGDSSSEFNICCKIAPLNSILFHFFLNKNVIYWKTLAVCIQRRLMSMVNVRLIFLRSSVKLKLFQCWLPSLNRPFSAW